MRWLLWPGFSFVRKVTAGRAQVCASVTGELSPKGLGRKASWGQGKKGPHLAAEGPVHSLTDQCCSLFGF